MTSIWARNCENETDIPVTGEVIQGEIPAWIDGTLIRNGPGKNKIGEMFVNHLFDGMALLQKFTIKDGVVTYMSKFLKSDSYKRNMAANRVVVSEFGTVRFPDPCKAFWQRNMVKFFPNLTLEDTDNCMISVCYFGDKLYAMTEYPYLRELHPETLDTLGDKVNLYRYVAVFHATAHPHVLPDGTLYNLGNSYMELGGPYYNIIEFPPLNKDTKEQEDSVFKRAKIVAKIPARWKMHPSYYHSFAITDNYWIFLEQPMCVSIPTMMRTRVLGQPFYNGFKFYPEEKVKFHIISRETGEEVCDQYFSDSFFTFHHINAYEAQDHIVLDLCMHTKFLSFEQMCHSRLSEECEKDNSWAKCYPTRFILPLQPQQSSGNLITINNTACKAVRQDDGSIFCTPENLSPESMDLPRINYNFNGKPYKYFYAAGLNGPAHVCKLHRVNAETKETVTYEEHGLEFSEPVFIQKPGTTGELEGVVLSQVLNLDDETEAGLVILDPKSWKVIARVTFRAQGVVTQNFHGQFAGPEDVHIF